MEKACSKKRKEYFEVFNLIRFAACILIFLYHYDGLCCFKLKLNDSALMDWIVRNGQEAIVLFFMLSGFCMAHGYRDKIMFRETWIGEFAWKHYRKFLQMILITAPLTVIKAFFLYKAGFDTIPNLFGFILDLLGIRTGYGLHSCFGYNGPLWFINVLFLIYLIYYLICTVARTETEYVIWGSVIFMFSLSQVAAQTFSFFILNTSTFIGLMGFFGGVLLYELHEFSCFELTVQNTANRICILFLLIAGITCLMNIHWIKAGTFSEGEDMWVNVRIVLTIMVWAPIVFLSSQIKVSRKSIIRKISGWAGSYATSVYIWHWPVMYLFYSWNRLGYIGWSLESWGGILIVWGSVFGIAHISDKYQKSMKQRQRS